jgi:hypothetical protein
VTGYTGTLFFTSADPQASLPAAYSFTAADAGSHSFLATLRTAGDHSITATDSQQNTVTGTSATILVKSGPAVKLAVTTASHVATGATTPFLVQARDQFQNAVTTYTGTVHVSSSDSSASLPADYTFQLADGGSHSFPIVLHAPGNQTLTVTDTAALGIMGSTTIRVTGVQPTTTSLMASLPVGVFLGFRQSATFTASVIPNPGPTGTVTFMDGVRVLGSVPLSGNVASLTLLGFTIGTHPITAIYDGDATFQFSAAAPVLLNASPKPRPRP